MIEKLLDTEKAAKLFGDWQETLIWSCLQNIMGDIYSDSDTPRTAMALLGDFCFFAGEPDREYVLFQPENNVRDFLIMVPQNEEWAALLEDTWKDRAKKVTRYAIRKEENIFDRRRLQKYIDSLPEGYELRMIDLGIFRQCKEEGWSRDLVSLYEGYESYQQLGIGAAVLKDGVPVCGASSYSRYRDGIEVEVDTKPGYRRQGLATVCASMLIVKCLERGLYPSWDAQNLWSVALAEKLGYHFDHPYTAFEVG